MNTALLLKAFGYQGDQMNLPVADVTAALPFYQKVLGFAVESRTDGPPRAAVLVRDQVRMRIAETGGDPTQDGCAFHVSGLDVLLDEFRAAGLPNKQDAIGQETRGSGTFRVFYVVAPDGLCFWFGEKQPSA